MKNWIRVLSVILSVCLVAACFAGCGGKMDVPASTTAPPRRLPLPRM